VRSDRQGQERAVDGRPAEQGAHQKPDIADRRHHEDATYALHLALPLSADVHEYRTH
jgi:hypothetical protein